MRILDIALKDLVQIFRDKRAALYQQMQQLTQEDPPFVYLYYPDSFEATRSRVVGYASFALYEPLEYVH